MHNGNGWGFNFNLAKNAISKIVLFTDAEAEVCARTSPFDL